MQILLSNFVGCAVHCDQIRAQFPMSCKSGGCGEGPICKIRPLCGRVTLARHRKERGPRFGSQRRFSRPGSCGLVLPAPSLWPQTSCRRWASTGPGRGLSEAASPVWVLATAEQDFWLGEAMLSPSQVQPRRVHEAGRVGGFRGRRPALGSWLWPVGAGGPPLLLTSVFRQLNGGRTTSLNVSRV